MASRRLFDGATIEIGQLPIVSSAVLTQAGYRSYVGWFFGGSGGFVGSGINPAIFASRHVVLGSGVY